MAFSGGRQDKIKVVLRDFFNFTAVTYATKYIIKIWLNKGTHGRRSLGLIVLKFPNPVIRKQLFSSCCCVWDSEVT